MKKIILVIASVLLLVGCGVGSYSVSSGKADEGAISFVSAEEQVLAVKIDGAEKSVTSVKTKNWRPERAIKKTAQNTLSIGTGSHEVEVFVGGNKVYSKKLFISAGEHKVVEL